MDKEQKITNDVKTFYLPSPSPAYRTISFEEKLKVYKKVLKI